MTAPTDMDHVTTNHGREFTGLSSTRGSIQGWDMVPSPGERTLSQHMWAITFELTIMRVEGPKISGATTGWPATRRAMLCVVWRERGGNIRWECLHIAQKVDVSRLRVSWTSPTSYCDGWTLPVDVLCHIGGSSLIWQLCLWPTDVGSKVINQPPFLSLERVDAQVDCRLSQAHVYGSLSNPSSFTAGSRRTHR